MKQLFLFVSISILYLYFPLIHSVQSLDVLPLQLKHDESQSYQIESLFVIYK